MHVFKYLEIQAIKEDRKRGVLTDSEYRRSYRHKASAGQLNDFRYYNYKSPVPTIIFRSICRFIDKKIMFFIFIDLRMDSGLMPGENVILLIAVMEVNNPWTVVGPKISVRM